MKGFSIKTEIQEYDTFEQFADDAEIGENDLVLCGEHTFDKYMASPKATSPPPITATILSL